MTPGLLNSLTVSASSMGLEKTIAWRAVFVCWLWGSLMLLSGMILGLATAHAETVWMSLRFWIWVVAMGGLFILSTHRLYDVAKLGLLNFAIARIGWLLLFTLVWCGLTAAPTGAYEGMFAALVGLSEQPAPVQANVIWSLIIGQGFVVFAGLAWLGFIITLFIPALGRQPKIGTVLMSLMLLACGLALGFGAHATGQLMILAISR